MRGFIGRSAEEGVGVGVGCRGMGVGGGGGSNRNLEKKTKQLLSKSFDCILQLVGISFMR